MINNLTKELAESLIEIRNFAAIGEIPAATYMVRADAVLDRYIDALRTPKPVITRVEVITDTREYVHWNPYNKITTSLQDDGKTLKVFVTQNTEEPMYPKQPKPINMVEIETKRWATALSGLIDELGGDSPALWEWKGKTPTPEKVVEYLRENIQYLQQLAADEELERCIEWVSIELNCTDQEHLVPYLREYRRPKPTLKSQALKDFEMVRKHSDLLPEILDTIENALKSIPE
jgi:hypothetical protein